MPRSVDFTRIVQRVEKRMKSKLLVLVTAVLILVTSAAVSSGVAYAFALDEINPGGDWATTGENDEQDLFPAGTPGPGAVTITNDGPGSVVVTIYEADGTTEVIPEGGQAGGTTVGPNGTNPTFTVPSGGRINVKGKTSKDATGTYQGSFVVSGVTS